MTLIAVVVDLLAAAFAFGACVWFFFIQSAHLLRTMDRERFVALQMRLTALLFRALPIALLIAWAASVSHSALTSRTSIFAATALGAALVQTFLILPSAFRAGGRSLSERSGSEAVDPTFVGFAAEGLGDRTRVLHRLVVVFVVLMSAAVIAHVVALAAGLLPAN